MTFEQLIDLIRANQQEELGFLQTKILSYSWEGKTYATLAEELHYREVYVKNAAYKLWQLVSDLLGMPVTKSNFRSIVEQYVII
jgi:flagellar capping protein FliD